jgi:DNA repair photolyase
MPGINDSPEQVEPIVDRAREAGATFLGGVALHLRDEVRDVFFAWLAAKRPDLIPKYERLYSNRAYLRPEQRKRTTRAVKGWGRTRSQRKAPEQPRQKQPRPRRAPTRETPPPKSPLPQEALF